MLSHPAPKPSKPHSLRLPPDVETQVQAFALTVARTEHRQRPAVQRVLVTLVEQGLKAVQPVSRKAGLMQALQELDPEWSGQSLRDHEPETVVTRSGQSPVQLMLARRG